ncbi:MAG: hypothetical protein K0S33_551 [Bacteroidetes bacterium]|jgi:hypothetical protein|nr:hypothetical protein [Bacteroidota bacterium]
MIKNLYYPNLVIPARLRAVKNIVSLGLLLSIASSWKLWTSDHLFPQAPLFNIGFSVTHPFDYILFVLFIVSIAGILVARRSRPFIVSTVLLGIGLAIFDQNRLQPWFYMYMIILGILGFYNWRVDEPKKHVGIYMSVTIVVGAIYFWSGIQKLNPNFMSSTWEWFIKPLERILTPEECIVTHKFGHLVPYMEIGIGIGLFFEPAKRVFIPLAIAMHLIILILLSPLFHNFNHTVWGWNLCMILLVWFLFAGETQSRYKQFYYLSEFKPFFAVVLLTVFLPGLNLINRWDSYLSANLYSGNSARVEIYLTENAKNKLPYYIQLYTKNDGGGLYTLQLKKWAMAEMGVPGYPEPRVFNIVYKHIQAITCCDDEVTLFVDEKKGLLADV